MKRNSRKAMSLILSFAMCLSFFSFATPASAEGIMDLPEAFFDVYGSRLDRGFLAAEVAGGVFLSWRYFPEEATGITNEGEIGAAGGLVGANFAVFKNGVKIADVTDSTDYIDTAGTAADEYVVVTVAHGGYISRTKALKPAPRLTAGYVDAAGNGADISGYLSFPVFRPADAVIPHNTIAGETQTLPYYIDEMQTADTDGDGQLELVIKFQGNSPDVINPGYTTPVIYQCYKLNGAIMWEVNLGINIRAGQHYSQPVLQDLDGDGKAEFLLKTAPGSKWRSFANGVYDNDVPYTYITMVETGQTLWDGTSDWSHTDDFRTNDWTTTPAAENGTLFKWMVGFFKNWQSHPEVTAAYWGKNSSENYYSQRTYTDAEGVTTTGYGWWKYPPQVLMGMYPAGYVGDNGPVTAAGSNNAFAASTADAGWTQEQWTILNAMPKDPAAFKSHVITDAEALALAHLFYKVKAPNVQRFTSGHVIDAPEFYTVFNGATGAEMDTIPYAVQVGFKDPVTGKYTPDIGIMWDDMTATAEPMNRCERTKSSAAYLDGNGKNPSALVSRGYYGRLTVMRYDWDGKELTGSALFDTGFEVLLNPFTNSATSNNGGRLFSTLFTHGGPGRAEGPTVFNPAVPGVEVRDEQGKGHKATEQGQHHWSIMDVDGDGRDEMIHGGVTLNSDGSVRHAEYQWQFANGSTSLVPGEGAGSWRHMGHGNSMHVGYFNPDQVHPTIFMEHVESGGWGSYTLQDVNTGEFLYIDGRGSTAQNPTSWGNTRSASVGRTMVGKFTDEPGWQLYATRNVLNTPLGTIGGLRQSDGSKSNFNPNPAPETNFSINFRPNLKTQTLQGSVDAIGDNLWTVSASYRGIALTELNAAQTAFETVLRTQDTLMHGGTKGQPAIVADILGDYREEMVLGTRNSIGAEVRIYFNSEDSFHKLASLMTDRRYTVEVNRQISEYNQPAYPGFYYGSDMKLDIYYDTIQDYYRANFTYPEPSELQPYDMFLPDPFAFVSGGKVTTPEQWSARAQELKDLAMFYEYGEMPDTRGEMINYSWNAAKSVLKLTVSNGDKTARPFTASVYYPPQTIEGPYPVVMALDSMSMSAANRNILVAGGYIVIVVNERTALGGTDGAGTAAVAADNATMAGSFNDLYPFAENSAGTITAWCWAASRVMDVLLAGGFETADPSKVAVTGFSRMGKCALAAGLYDDRFALVHLASSGAGGAGTYRIATDYEIKAYPWGEIVHNAGMPSETTEIMRDLQGRFPFWFGDRYSQVTKGFSDPQYLPYDHHELIAALAPRPVFLTFGTSDWWCNAEAMYVGYYSAEKVYNYLGIGDKIGLRTRAGGHSVTADDIRALLEFCNVNFKGATSEAGFKTTPYTPSPAWDTVRAPGAPDEVNGIRTVRYIVDGLSLNIPAYVKAVNNGGKKIFASLFIDGVKVAEKEVTDGAAVFEGCVAEAGKSYYVTAYFEGADPAGGIRADVFEAIMPLDDPDNAMVWSSGPAADPTKTGYWWYGTVDIQRTGRLNTGSASALYNGQQRYNINFQTKIALADDYEITLNGIPCIVTETDNDAVHKVGITILPLAPLESHPDYTAGKPINAVVKGVIFPDIFPDEVFTFSSTDMNMLISDISPKTLASGASVSKTALGEKMEQARALNPASYANYDEVARMLKIVQKVYNNAVAPQFQIDAAYEALVFVIDGLVPVTAAVTSLNYTGFTNLVAGCAANIPVAVTADNPAGLPISAGLFVDDVLVASAAVVDGAAVIKAPVINGESAYIAAWLGDDVAGKVTKAVPLKQLPTDIWTPVVDTASPQGKTIVYFAEDITLKAGASVTINGVTTTDLSADGKVLTINATSAAGDKLVLKGVKFPALFPSYSFTFTLVRGADAP